MKNKVKINASQHYFLSMLTKEIGGKKIPEELTYFFIEAGISILLTHEKKIVDNLDVVAEYFKLADKRKNRDEMMIVMRLTKDFVELEKYKSLLSRKIPVTQDNYTVISTLAKDMHVSESVIVSNLIEVSRLLFGFIYTYMNTDKIFEKENCITSMKKIIDNNDVFLKMGELIEKYWVKGAQVSKQQKEN